MNLNEVLKLLVEAGIFIIFGIIIKALFDSKKYKENIKVKKQAYTDQLTGRGNRYLFYSVIDKLIIKNKRFAVCFLDLDGFKQINDTMGHDAGDELLIALANSLDENLPKNATSYRLGGDEFSIIIENIKTTADVAKVLDSLKEKFKTPFCIGGTNISLEYSLGIAMYPEDAANRKDLVMYADDAMYYIKEHGKNDYYFHNKVLRAKIENDNKMQVDLKKAFEEKQFGLDLQPRIYVNDTSKLCFEALLYWNHPILGKLPSAYFIKQADEIALTIKLDQFILNEVCKHIKKYKELGHQNIKFAINISNRHASKKDFMDKLCQILNENSIDNGDIILELNDNIEFKNIENYKLLFERLKECGAEIMIKNYEIEYDSLKLLKELKVDSLKLSASYITDGDDIDDDIFYDVLNLSKKLDYDVVINKIENEKQLKYAVKAGADYIQGDFLFKRLDEKLIDEFIQKYPNYTSKIDNLIQKNSYLYTIKE